jgi:hypothetical protein
MGFVSQKASEQLVVAVKMKKVVTVGEDAAELFGIYVPLQTAVFLFMHACNQVPLILQKKQEQKLFTLR